MQKDLSPKQIYELLNNNKKKDDEAIGNLNTTNTDKQNLDYFSYVQLNFHPYKEFRPLGYTNKEGTQNWINLPERILYVSKK